MSTSVAPRLKSLYLGRPATVTAMQPLTDKEKLFGLELADGPLGHEPGQFVEVSVLGYGEAPISVASSPTAPGGFQLCVRNVGRVTGALHRLEPGAVIGIRGPFGRGFPVDRMRNRDILFVAGGLGLAPLRSLIHYVLDRRQEFGHVTILVGARSPAELLFREEYATWARSPGTDVHVTVDRADGSWSGHVGVITTLFPRIQVDPKTTITVIVGPPVMYRFALMETFSKGVPQDQVYVSLERRMKCGVGKCGHCQINGIYVCQKGPVFAYTEIAGLEEAL
ncbi:MAG: FAD/NAD(P)-binding protein [Anaerolineae bacterium]|nr:FAD/NAD(P)-binding protein [Anaerolineae bacterium]